MKRAWVVIFFLFCITGAAQTPLRKLTFGELQAEIMQEKQALVVLNFWATWCKPCVEELPDFEKITTVYSTGQVKVILANLDFHSQTDALVIPFLQRKALQSPVVHISDADPGSWINTADPRWSGAIPATLMYYQGKQIWFYEGKTDYRILDSIITNTLHP